MTTRLGIRRCVAAVWGAWLGGCAGGGAGSEADAARLPVMPTVTPPVAAVAVAVGEGEVVANVLDLVQAGNLPAARRAIEGVADLAQRQRVGETVIVTAARSDPRQAAELAAGLSVAGGRTRGLELAAATFVARDAEAALSWALESSDSAVAGIARRAVVQQLVRANPQGAVDRILARPVSPARDDTLGFAAAAWARIDATAAVNWLHTLASGDLRDRLTSSIGFEIAQQHPESAVELAETLPAGRNRWLLFSAIAQTWVATDAKSALAWAGRLPAGEARAAAFAGLDTGLGVPTARRVAHAPGSRTVRSRGLGGGVAEAALSAGGSADFAAWLATQPPGVSRDEAILEFVRQRGAADSGAIGQWLASLSPGATRDRAMEVYLEGQLIGSPQRAADWLRALPRSDRSEELIEKTARAWLRTNPEAAQAWLLETPLPPDRKERLLREAGR